MPGAHTVLLSLPCSLLWLPSALLDLSLGHSALPSFLADEHWGKGAGVGEFLLLFISGTSFSLHMEEET